MNWKKILGILAFILVAVGIGFAIWWTFFRVPPTAVPPVNVPVNVPPGGLPIAPPGAPPTGAVVPPAVLPTGPSPVAAGGLTAVTPIAPVPTVGASMSSAGSLSYWNRNDSKFYRVGPDGVPTALSGKTFYNVDNATFDPNGEKAIIEYPDGANILYDFRSGRQVTLPQHWESFDFSATGDKIAAKSITLDVNSRYLLVSDPDGTEAKAIQALGDNADKVTVSWSPTSQIVAMSETGPSHGFAQQEIYFIGQNKENFKSLTLPGMMFQPQWTPSGRQMLFSVASEGNDYRPGLWVVDASGNDIGKNRRNLNVNTWADKCVFADDETVYCAVPRDLPRGAGLQPAIADQTPDSIYRVNIKTGSQTKIADPEGDHTVGQLMLSPDGKMLYFTDKASGSLNKMQLAP